jgi:beta-galactosidase GanA
MTCSLVVAIEPTGQNTQPTNYARMLDMADALNAALRTNRGNLGAIVTWTISAQDTEPIIVGQTAYWGVTASVTKRG